MVTEEEYREREEYLGKKKNTNVFQRIYLRTEHQLAINVKL